MSHAPPGRHAGHRHALQLLYPAADPVDGPHIAARPPPPPVLCEACQRHAATRHHRRLCPACADRRLVYLKMCHQVPDALDVPLDMTLDAWRWTRRRDTPRGYTQP